MTGMEEEDKERATVRGFLLSPHIMKMVCCSYAPLDDETESESEKSLRDSWSESIALEWTDRSRSEQVHEALSTSSATRKQAARPRIRW